MEFNELRRNLTEALGTVIKILESFDLALPATKRSRKAMRWNRF